MGLELMIFRLWDNSNIAKLEALLWFVNQNVPTTLDCANKNIIQIVRNSVFHKRPNFSRHHLHFDTPYLRLLFLLL